ncbi:unnamed protein product [Miscanthus lutarioriparius]|uniref:Uncharacterized protein n=1 Tax=Miscanthus lutarioriparius TaxID=422564 RepID=A0A811MAA8_9POAL|nr:unnamed protein product [Miscanthus lutarioriparius]
MGSNGLMKASLTFGLPQLPHANHVQVNQGKARAYKSLQDSSYWAKVLYCFVDHFVAGRHAIYSQEVLMVLPWLGIFGSGKGEALAKE